MEVVLETKNLCKSFGAVMVNDKINLTLHRGEIMAVLGENGSGKTTLINMIGGIYYPDSGSIYYENKRVEIRSPKDADRLGIGVVHQHFKLVSSMDAVENIEIALSDKEYKNKADIRKRITDVAKKYGFTVNPDKKICDMSVSEKQTVEIIKAIKNFINEYKKGTNPKGIYLHGSFGSGKTYLISALFNELAKSGTTSVIIHTPELLRSLKDSFSTDYSEKFYLLKHTPLLLLDDIGAEYLTAWGRDEVIEPILQYRMDEGLPTFFTSNFTILELEKHFTTASNSIDKVKARRIIERIKQLSVEVELISKNLR